MNDVCPKCGLKKELCVCETIAKEIQRIKVYTVKRKFGKINTIVEGIDGKEIDVKELAKKLKSELACGGTVKEGKIELQGEHTSKVRKSLINMGFAQESIAAK